MTDDLLMICPSRGRPKNIWTLVETWQDTMTGGARLLVAVDDDDPELAGYQDLFRLYGPRLGELYIGPRLRVGSTLNQLAVERAPKHFAIGFLGDDHRLRTPGWDQTFLRNLHELGTGLVYGDDLFQRERLPTAVAMTSDIVAALGYMVPPGLTHLFFDNAWLGLGQTLGCIRYLPEVVIEHVHPVAGKTEWDAGYEEVNAPEMYAKDRATFARWIREDSQAALKRVREIRRVGQHPSAST